MDAPQVKNKEEKGKPRGNRPKSRKRTNEKKDDKVKAGASQSKGDSQKNDSQKNDSQKNDSQKNDSQKNDNQKNKNKNKNSDKKNDKPKKNDKSKNNKKSNDKKDDKTRKENNKSNDKKDDRSKKEENPKKKNNQHKKNAKNDSKSGFRENSRINRRETQRLQAAVEQNYKKLVVRLLPPMLSEKKFWDTIDPQISDDMNKYFEENGIVEHYFHQGGPFSRYSHLSSKKKSFSRMYIVFKDLEFAKRFSLQIRDMMFTDDQDNSNKPGLKISQYVKLFINTSKRSRIDNSSLEGTIEDDDIFKNFIKSMEYVKAHQFEEDLDGICMLKPIESELKVRRKRRAAAAKAAELALTKLSGASLKSKKKKNKDNGEKSKNKKKKRKRRRRKRSTREGAAEGTSKSNGTEVKNMVILEKAGKQILRDRLKSEKKKGSATSLPALKATSSSTDSPPVKMTPKILKRET